MRIILDCDDVLFASNEMALYLLNMEHHTNYTLRDITRWGGISEILDKRLAYFEMPEFIKQIPVYEGAKRFTEELLKMGEVFVATSTPFCCADAKVQRICSELPGIRPENIIIGSRKDILQGDMMLDDSVVHVKASQTDVPVLFDKPWNESEVSCLRAGCYEDFLAMAERQMKKQSERIFRVVPECRRMEGNL